MTRFIAALLVAVMFQSCASRPKTHTEVPSLRYAQKYVEDAKDGNSRAIKSNDEIDIAIKKLLQGVQ